MEKININSSSPRSPYQKRVDTPMFHNNLRPHTTSTISGMDEFERIKKCRYIRKTVLQRGDSQISEIDLSLLFRQMEDTKKNEGQWRGENDEKCLNQLEQIEENVEQEKVEEVKVEEPVRPIKRHPPRLRPVSPIQPFIIHPAQVSGLNRDKMEPLRFDFSEKCSISTTTTTTTSEKSQKPKHSKKMEQLHREISKAARNANIDLSTTVQDVKESRKTKDNLLSRCSDKSKKRWVFLSSLVRSGWLLSKKGRALKLIKDRRQKRRIQAINLATLPLSPRAAMKKEEKTIQTSFLHRRLAANRSLPLNDPSIFKRTLRTTLPKINSHRRGSSFI